MKPLGFAIAWLALVLIATPVAGQQGDPPIMVAASAAAGAGPEAFYSGCAYSGRIQTTEVGLDVGLRFDRVRLLSRIAVTGESILSGQESCDAVVPAYESGVHTDTLYPFDRNGHVLTEVRIGYEFPARVSWHADAGFGYAWLPKSPHAVGVLGARFGQGVRVGVDAEGRLQRVALDDLIRRWASGEVVETVSRNRRYNWIASPILRVVLEMELK